MKGYLIDTNIAIFYMKGMYNLKDKFKEHPQESYYLSEITLAELKFGAENSERKVENRATLDNFLSGVQIVPIFHSIDLYAKEKARLRKAGTPIDDFDLLIGVTSITQNLIMVTNNISHFKRISNIILEDWSKAR